MRRHALAAAAESLVGSPFRLHGRDPGTGLDCIGLLFASLRIIGLSPAFPTGYRIRTSDYPSLPSLAAVHGFIAAESSVVPGDVLFVRPGPAQLHLVIAGTRRGSLVEAHAGVGRVISRAGPPIEPIIQHWRLQNG